MRKILLLFLFISSFSFAQYSIKGNLEPVDKYNWVFLYKLEGARQSFVKNASLKKETKTVNGKSIEVGSFEFTIPEDEEQGVYRITYDLKNNGYADLLFNKESIDFTINPNLPQVGLTFHSSKENELYENYKNAIATLQYKLDSVHINYLRKPSEKDEITYTKLNSELNRVQSSFEQQSKNTFAYDFIKAFKRYNPSTPQKNYDAYLNGVINHFFDYIDFENKSLLKSSFLVDRIADYIFYMNYSQDKTKQQLLYKRSSDYAIEKIKDIKFKADVMEFLISQFAALQNTELVDYLFEKQYDQLPAERQNKEFKEKILKQLVTAIGAVAPDFSWQENGKTLKLSELTDGQNYLLIFYSTECSHCLREVPQVHEYLKAKNKTKVIAFAMETSDTTWNTYKNQFPEWHNALGLGKWDNETARLYQINSTPTYIVLGMDKKIIAKPDKLDDLKKILAQLN